MVLKNLIRDICRVIQVVLFELARLENPEEHAEELANEKGRRLRFFKPHEIL